MADCFMVWSRSKIGAAPGRTVWRMQVGGHTAIAEPGRDTGWWYWRVVRGDQCWTGQSISLRQAKKDAENCVWV